MNAETTHQTNKRGVLATAISLSLLLSACGGSDSTPPPPPPVPGVTATPSTLTIAEDSSTTFEVVLNSEPTADVVISVTSADVSEATTSVADLTFTNSAGTTPWDVPRTVTVSGVIDFTADGNQNINVVLSATSSTDMDYNALAATNVATTVSDIDTAGFTVSDTTLSTSENGSGNNYQIVLNAQPDGDVVIDISSADTNEGSVTPATLTFDASNWNAVQTVFVIPVDDLIADGNQTYNITMAVNAGATADTTGYAGLTLAPIAVTNADDDTAGFTVSETTLITTEIGANVTYSVVLNTVPDGDVVVDISSADTNEGTVAPATLTFNAANFNAAQTVTVSPVDDLMADGNQTYDITMAVDASATVDTTGYAGLTLAPVAVTNTDNDTAGFTVSETTLNTTENGGTVNYTVVLNTMPDGDVVVGVASTDPGEGVADTISLPFNPVNWATPQTVTVTPVEDAFVDGHQLYHIAMTINPMLTSDSTGYAGLTLTAVAVTNEDDDTTEGTLLSPAVLALGADLPHSGKVDSTDSYYEITGLTAGVSYSISLTGMSDNTNLFVFEDSALAVALCDSFLAATNDEACNAIPGGTSLWIRVDGSMTAAGATYTLNVQPPLVPGYSSSNTPLALADNGTMTDTLDVITAPASLAQVEVLMDLTHTWDADLDITLISPAGTRVLLTSDNGGGSENYTNTTFSDAAVVSITSLLASAPFAGWYVPEEALSVLNGEDGNGVWSLEIIDDTGSDTGDLLNWGLKLQ